MNEELKRGIPKAIKVGYEPVTAEEEKEAEEWLRSIGKLKEDEHLDDFERDPETGLVHLGKKKKK